MDKLIDKVEKRLYQVIKERLIEKAKPDVCYHTVQDMDLEEIKKWKSKYGIGGILLDVDDTLRRDLRKVSDINEEWLAFLKSEFRVALLSNGKDDKIKELAEKYQIEYIAFANKPFRKAFLETADKLGLEPENILVMGDSLFDDIYGGKRSGMRTALIKEVKER